MADPYPRGRDPPWPPRVSVAPAPGISSVHRTGRFVHGVSLLEKNPLAANFRAQMRPVALMCAQPTTISYHR